MSFTLQTQTQVIPISSVPLFVNLFTKSRGTLLTDVIGQRSTPQSEPCPLAGPPAGFAMLGFPSEGWLSQGEGTERPVKHRGSQQ